MFRSRFLNSHGPGRASLRFASWFVSVWVATGGSGCLEPAVLDSEPDRVAPPGDPDPSPRDNPEPPGDSDPLPDPDPHPNPDPSPDPGPEPDPNPEPGPDPDADPDPDPDPVPDPTPKPPQIVATADSIAAVADGMRSDPEKVAPAAAVQRVTWNDAAGRPRSVVLGPYLYEYEFSFDDNRAVVERSVNDDAWGHEGFGYVVSHNTQNGNSPLGKANPPTRVTTTVLTGGHHAIHRVELMYDRDREGGGFGIRIPVVIEWLVATGRDHPVWAVTWRVGAAENPQNVDFNAYRMDVRGPYGSLNFDGAASRNQGDAIGGVAWGDFGLQFTTTDAQLTMDSPWTYNTANRVPFTHVWTANTNAEMGIVLTRPDDKTMGYPDRVYGRERGSTSAGVFTDKNACNGFGDNRAYSMPCINGWPFQLMNYDWYNGGGKPLGEATGTKLIAWGTPYGWLGASSFDLFDYSGVADGRGDRSYATFIVLGPRARYDAGVGTWSRPGDVDTTVERVQSLADATFSEVTTGSLASRAARGPGATQTKPLTNGYNDTYAAYYLDASDNAAAFTITPGGGPIDNPIFVMRGYDGRDLPTVTVNGAPVSVNNGRIDSGAWVSVNDRTDELWVTLNARITATTRITIGR